MADSYVVYNTTTWRLLRMSNGTQYFESAKSAKSARTRMINAEEIAEGDWAVDTALQYFTNMPMRETYNILDPERKPIVIRACDIGTCCDPATETYHSM